MKRSGTYSSCSETSRPISLGRLAVDQSSQGQGLGEHLLLEALHRSLAHADQIAAMSVVVDAKDESTATFCRHCGFISLQP